ncbi:hypothetical protein CC85DRAFT_289244 [Cutaneotrichosporon oleaginosum]|uniref:Uncharacterized protein n=1 Tax=Cutaneotrichosporon oleaginosum TaxID=879819 RepID=A0A0J0XCC4_9TREE|nr:uncharacterized protein CC85DRAFT_289244 [Cutaneotrichosporon oleaginosum]KLT38733.1 hypothetical protein CC85DRAFT_289244 [Cutaneotrichosporon oleaginosum]TXT06911.1 hypothetical protein COLE_06242 [Cutaneotrichosporon oleaginosum]
MTPAHTSRPSTPPIITWCSSPPIAAITLANSLASVRLSDSPATHSPLQPTVTIPADAFPHIIDLIFDSASRAALTALRTACSTWRERADSYLLAHVVVQRDCEPILPNGGPVCAHWTEFRPQLLDLVDIDGRNPCPLPSQVYMLRTGAVEGLGKMTLPRSHTLVLSAATIQHSSGACQSWKNHLSRTTRLVIQYATDNPRNDVWDHIGSALADPSCTVTEVVFLFPRTTSRDPRFELDLLIPIRVICWKLRGQGRAPVRLKMTLVNALPWLAVALDKSGPRKSERRDMVACFLGATGLGRGDAAAVKAAFGHYLDFVTCKQYAARVGAKDSAREKFTPRRIGSAWLLDRYKVLPPVDTGRSVAHPRSILEPQPWRAFEL